MRLEPLYGVEFSYPEHYHVEGVDSLQLHILKRRGPPLETPLALPAHSARMAALLETRKGREALAPPPTAPASPPVVTLHRRSHVLDRPLAIT